MAIQHTTDDSRPVHRPQRDGFGLAPIRLIAFATVFSLAPAASAQVTILNQFRRVEATAGQQTTTAIEFTGPGPWTRNAISSDGPPQAGVTVSALLSSDIGPAAIAVSAATSGTHASTLLGDSAWGLTVTFEVALPTPYSLVGTRRFDGTGRLRLRSLEGAGSDVFPPIIGSSSGPFDISGILPVGSYTFDALGVGQVGWTPADIVALSDFTLTLPAPGPALALTFLGAASCARRRR
jgi:hypothetical protein